MVQHMLWRLRGAPMVVVQDPAEAFTTNEGGGVVAWRRGREQKSIAEPLVVAFEMIVIDEHADGLSKMPFAQQHELVEALGPDRQHEALGASVESGL